MKRLAIVLVGVLLAAGCSSSNSSSPSTTNPNQIRFTAALSPSQETPPITNAESVGSGSVTIDMTLTRDATNAISAATVNFQANMQGFPSTTIVNIAHIHQGAAGVAGPILVNTTVNPGEVVLTSGVGTFTRTSISVSPTTAQEIIDNPAGFYFNIHTTLNPGGVMRGQLVKQ
ncbi:MAG TPA: CHRD domain-containing protein [Vicinamibacterales bacterium]|nr:CHRD domain-containing protein [Vicinamibacterales bacterium]